MTIDLMRAPFPITYRELWLPRGIKGLTGPLPPSRYNGHELAFTGARRGTTSDGVYFTRAATSNINCGAIHNNAATYWVRFRFKLDQPYAAGSGDMYLWGKFEDDSNFVWLVLKTVDGKLYFEGQDGAVNDFSIAAQDGVADITSWEAGRWYTVIASISAANDVRFIIDNGTVVTHVTAIAFPATGDFVIGDYDDPGAGTGFEGVIADFFGSTIDNTVAEEGDLFQGIPPADVVNEYLLDEGRGGTAYDRGSGVNNGTLDAAGLAAVPPTLGWAWGRVKQPVISLDGINDVAISSAGVDIRGALTVVWAGKMKSTYDNVIAAHKLVHINIDANNEITIYYQQANGLTWYVVRGGDSANVQYSTTRPVIDDYQIVIGTLTAAGVIGLFSNGVSLGTDTGAGAIAGAATAYIGRDDAAQQYDISKPLMVALIEGAFDQQQAKAYSRWIDRIFNLGVVT